MQASNPAAMIAQFDMMMVKSIEAQKASMEAHQAQAAQALRK